MQKKLDLTIWACVEYSIVGINIHPCVLFISTDNSILKQTNIPCSCARSCLFFQKISEYCVNTRPWGPWRPSRGLYRRAASLLGWKSSLSQLFLDGNFTFLSVGLSLNDLLIINILSRSFCPFVETGLQFSHF